LQSQFSTDSDELRDLRRCEGFLEISSRGARLAIFSLAHRSQEDGDREIAILVGDQRLSVRKCRTKRTGAEREY
jgi:hypothetical protein